MTMGTCDVKREGTEARVHWKPELRLEPYGNIHNVPMLKPVQRMQTYN